MAIRSVAVPTTSAPTRRPLFQYQWMRHFFTKDVSSASRPIVELQRRACWIALAILLFTQNELDHSRYLSLLGTAGQWIHALFLLLCTLAGFWSIWMAIRPASRRKQVVEKPRTTRLWQRLVLILAMLMTIPGTLAFGYTIVQSFFPPQFTNDGTSLDTNAAILLLQGRNPYTDSNIPELMRRFDIQPNWTTPLRLGQFEGRLDYPSQAELQSVLNTSLKANHLPEFEEKVSYPALSFLTLVPFVMFGNYNVFPFYLLCYLAMIGLAWRISRPEIRPWVLLLSMANFPMWISITGGNLDILCSLLVVLAWWQRDHRWGSALFFGLALATKQLAWFIAPFYLIMNWRNYGFLEACRRASFAGGVALLVNLPFILWDVHAWFAGVMTPIADPMFPMGVGLVNLSVKQVIPYLPTSTYTILEAVAMLAALAFYWVISRKRPEAALLLATVPLFFAWRSLPSYFSCLAFPTFIIMTAQVQQFSYTVLAQNAVRKVAEAIRIPVPVRVRA